MQSLLKYSLLFLCSVLFAVCFSKYCYRAVGVIGLLPDDYQFGDLYRLSHLPQFKLQRDDDCVLTTKNGESNTQLLVIGDSFLEESRVKAGYFVSDVYRFTHWDSPMEVGIKAGSKNIFLLESVERTFRRHMALPDISVVKVNSDLLPVQNANFEVPLFTSEFLKEELRDFLHLNGHLRQAKFEERADNLLFGWPLFAPFRELKAAFNQKVFGRISEKVKLSSNEQHLFFSEDRDTTIEAGSAKFLPQSEIDSIIIKLNRGFDYYSSKGFSKIYLSIIPDKTTILEPNLRYHHGLIDRLKSDKRLKMKFIDAEAILRPLGAGGYLVGDSHWNCAGKKAWIDAVNNQITTDFPVGNQ